jgi:nonsense-mediated mRNA decay protein 3
MMSYTPLTVVQIPCCVCGTLIIPNAANQCATCLAQECDLSGVLHQKGSALPEVKQCRQCRRFQRKPKMWQELEMESPQLLSLCLHILQPAMSSMKLVDAIWVWTEPHSMRLKLRLTVRQVVLGTTIEQRVIVEFKIVWEQCPDCNREFTNRTWHAVVQVRQKRDTPASGNLSTDGPKTGLAALEMALAKNADIRKHVIRMDTKRQGFDFYFLQLHEGMFT